MNARQSAERIPDAIRPILVNQPAIRRRLEIGSEWGDILSSPEWAAEWAAAAPSDLKTLLAWLLTLYAGLPFDEFSIESEAERQGRFTGAEVRVGLTRLRRSGVLFAIRKAWGDRLYYIPTDMVPVWLGLLMPVAEQSLTEAEAREAEPIASEFRLPLSLELLSAWAMIRRYGLPFTAKGSVAKPFAVRLASAMRLTSEELAPLELTGPQFAPVPAQVAFTLDIGLCVGVLEKCESGYFVSSSGITSWLHHACGEAETALYRLAVQRYASADAKRHLAASAVASCTVDRWYRTGDLLHSGIDDDSLDQWLSLLVSFGWAERGTWYGENVFRVLCPFEQSPAAVTGTSLEEPFYVQPDEEIIVPPGVSLLSRWTLEEIAERIVADQVFVYRLTRAAMSHAVQMGFDETRVTAFLETGSEAPLPPPVRETLTDWFSRLGKITFVETALLRVDSEETAGRLLDDPEIAPKLGERLGTFAFIVDHVHLKGLKSRLEKIGYPPVSGTKATDEHQAQNESSPVETRSRDPDSASTDRGHILSVYAPDHTLPGANELFPGLAEVPTAWLRQPAAYHTSTRRELIRRAIDWRTALRLQDGEDTLLFVPRALDDRGEQWEVRGHWRWPGHSTAADTANPPACTVTLSPDRLGAFMIVIPEIDTNS